MQHTLSAFSFLTDEYGFVVTKRSESCVSFGRGQLEIRVFHDWKGNDIDVDMLYLKKTYPLSTAMALAGIDSGRAPSAGSERLVVRFVHEEAEKLRTYARRLLDGDLSLLTEMGALQEKNLRDQQRADHVKNVKKRAEVAFRARDYATALKLYGSVDDTLTKSEQKRLDISRKRAPPS